MGCFINMMEYDFDWQEQWENGSDEEFKTYAQMTDKELIECLKKQDLGLYNRIWQVLKERKNKAFIKPLWATLKELKGDGAFLERQHCTETLFQQLKLRNSLLLREIIGSSTEFDEQIFKNSLKKLQTEIKKRIT